MKGPQTPDKRSLLEKLESLVSLSLKENIYELELEEKGSRIRFRRAKPPSKDKEREGDKKKLHIACEEVISPLTGTFYQTPSPHTPPFVEVGNTVEKGQTLGLIGAMKLFNEIKSEVSGKVVEILVKNGQDVKRGEVLMRIEKR